MIKNTTEGIIDRFEGSFAVLLLGHDEETRLDIPKELLPEKAKEGDRISVILKVSPSKTKEAKNKVEQMIKELREQNSK